MRHRHGVLARPAEVASGLPEVANPFDDTRPRHFITTAGAIGLALINAGATVATNVYGTRSTNRENRRATEAQRAAEAEAARLEAEQQRRDTEAQERLEALEREKLAAREKARQEALAFDRERWNTYLEASRPMWDLSGRVFGNLLDLAGGGRGGGVPTGGVPGAALMGAAGMGGGPSPMPLMAGGGDGEPTLMDLARGTRDVSRPRYQPRQFPIATAPPSRAGMSLMDLARLASMGAGSTSGRPNSSRYFLPQAGVNG